MLTIAYEEYLKTVEEAISFVHDHGIEELASHWSIMQSSWNSECGTSTSLHLDETILKSKMDHIIFEPKKISLQYRPGAWNNCPVLMIFTIPYYTASGYVSDLTRRKFQVEYHYEGYDVRSRIEELEPEIPVFDRVWAVPEHGEVWSKDQLHRTDRTFEVLQLIFQRIIHKYASYEDKVFAELRSRGYASARNGEGKLHISYT